VSTVVTGTTRQTGASAPHRSPPRRRPRGQWARRAPLLPALIFMIAVTQLPFVTTVYISLLNWNAYRPTERHFTGITNYETVFTDPRIRASVIATVILTVVVVVVSLALGLGIAILLDRHFFGRSIVRTLMIAPFLIVPVGDQL